jgi:hypothetical protein
MTLEKSKFSMESVLQTHQLLGMSDRVKGLWIDGTQKKLYLMIDDFKAHIWLLFSSVEDFKLQLYFWT